MAVVPNHFRCDAGPRQQRRGSKCKRGALFSQSLWPGSCSSSADAAITASSVPCRSCRPRTRRGAWPASSRIGADGGAVAGQLRKKFPPSCQSRCSPGWDSRRSLKAMTAVGAHSVVDEGLGCLSSRPARRGPRGSEERGFLRITSRPTPRFLRTARRRARARWRRGWRGPRSRSRRRTRNCR